MAFRPNKSFRSIIDDLGLSTGLQLCLDAGDAASYPGSGQKWLDRAQGYDFFLGPDGTVTGTDPTFTGTAGDLKDTTYWALDGTQYFRYDSANEVWMESFHKAGAELTIVLWLQMGALGAGTAICGTQGATAGGTGFSFIMLPANQLQFQVINVGVNVLAIATDSPARTFAANEWAFIAVSVDESAGANGAILQLNGGQQVWTSTYVSPAAGNASFSMEIGARGNANLPLPNLSRIGATMMWNRALSAAELMSIYQYPGISFTSDASPRSRNVMVGY